MDSIMHEESLGEEDDEVIECPEDFRCRIKPSAKDYGWTLKLTFDATRPVDFT